MTAGSYRLRTARPAEGFAFMYAIRTARAWWYSAWLRTLARFSRTYFGSFWLGLSNLLSVALLGLVYGAVFKVADPYKYAVYLGIGITIWGLLSQSLNGGCALLTMKRDQLVNNSMPAIFYCLEEWAFQVQTFAQAFLIILIAGSIIEPSLIIHAFTSALIPLLNAFLFCLWMIIGMSLLGARYKDASQLIPIILQLLFLVSPILYKRENLGALTILADMNPLYQILAPLRNAVIHGTFNLVNELFALVINGILIFVMMFLMRRYRYRLPLWV